MNKLGYVRKRYTSYMFCLSLCLDQKFKIVCKLKTQKMLAPEKNVLIVHNTHSKLLEVS
jgi:hypothetical protein